MRTININSSLKKKVRGKKRKTKDMIESITKQSISFPEVDLEGGYWHMHLPIKQSFINSEKTPLKIKRLCIQAIIDRTEELIKIKPKTEVKIRVIAFINLPDLWYSEIIIFFGDSHYTEYFYRNNEYQKWIPLENKRDIAKEWGINVPDTFIIRGYREELMNDDLTYENELWYLGEI